MDPRFITKNIHAYLDYPVALSLMILPFILQLGSSNPLAFWLAVIAGGAAFVLTVFTDHQFGLIRIIPYTAHVAVDLMVGIAFLLAPFLFGFSGLDAWYYWINGIAVITVVSLNAPSSSESTDHAPA